MGANFFYYRFYLMALKSSMSSIAQYAAVIYVGGLIAINFITINGLLAKLNIIPFLFRNKYYGGGFAILLIAFSWWYYLSSSRYVSIVNNYSTREDVNKVRENIFFFLYLTLSIFLLFVLPFYKPRYLPTI
jgi:hypothetical protein